MWWCTIGSGFPFWGIGSLRKNGTKKDEEEDERYPKAVGKSNTVRCDMRFAVLRMNDSKPLVLEKADKRFLMIVSSLGLRRRGLVSTASLETEKKEDLPRHLYLFPLPPPTHVSTQDRHPNKADENPPGFWPWILSPTSRDAGKAGDLRRIKERAHEVAANAGSFARASKCPQAEFGVFLGSQAEHPTPPRVAARSGHVWREGSRY